jgi:CRISPR/Cas system CSM-associated protein Csm4 (group 5 of RAMP superfamily)
MIADMGNDEYYVSCVDGECQKTSTCLPTTGNSVSIRKYQEEYISPERTSNNLFRPVKKCYFSSETRFAFWQNEEKREHEQKVHTATVLGSLTYL